jgi:hypothetical protein
VDYQASEGWGTNAAGYNFHNWYGFGAVKDKTGTLELFKLNIMGY